VERYAKKEESLMWLEGRQGKRQEDEKERK